MYKKVEAVNGRSAFALKGDICYTIDSGSIISAPESYLICENGLCAGVYRDLPEKYSGVRLMDFGERLIIPGLVDLHIHAPQYPFRGLGMDLELLDWLEKRAFPEEIRYADEEYASRQYKVFADSLASSATTRACIFSTVHSDATRILMDLMEKSGLITYVGKVSMDRNGPEKLTEETGEALSAVREWLFDIKDSYERTMPILTPRFIPTCSDDLMEGLGAIREEFNLPVQSHLSENKNEVAWVHELCPWAASYGDAYDRFGMFRGNAKTVMAHCVWPGDGEAELLKERGVYVAHCPESNMNLSSGIAPVRKYLDSGVKTGLGSDVAGGSSPSIFRAMREAVQVSKLYWRFIDDSAKPVTVPEVFYMATKGGGSFFGKVGSFEAGYEFDAVVLDDEGSCGGRFNIEDRLERIIYLSDEPKIAAKFVAGKRTKTS